MLAFTLIGLGQAAMWVAGVITALGIIAKAPPTRWLWRRNLAEPIMAVFRREVSQVVDERLNARRLTNGWGTEAVQAIAGATGAEVEPPHHQDPPGD